MIHRTMIRELRRGAAKACLTVLALALAACATGEGGGGLDPDPIPPVIQGDQRIEVLGDVQAYLVDIAVASAEDRRIVIWPDGPPGLGEGDRSTAFALARRAGAVIDCGDGALVVEQGSGAFVAPPPAHGDVAPGRKVWQFKGRCGG